MPRAPPAEYMPVDLDSGNQPRLRHTNATSTLPYPPVHLARVPPFRLLLASMITESARRCRCSNRLPRCGLPPTVPHATAPRSASLVPEPLTELSTSSVHPHGGSGTRLAANPAANAACRSRPSPQTLQESSLWRGMMILEWFVVSVVGVWLLWCSCDWLATPWGGRLCFWLVRRRRCVGCLVSDGGWRSVLVSYAILWEQQLARAENAAAFRRFLAREERRLAAACGVPRVRLVWLRGSRRWAGVVC